MGRFIVQIGISVGCLIMFVGFLIGLILTILHGFDLADIFSTFPLYHPYTEYLATRKAGYILLSLVEVGISAGIGALGWKYLRRLTRKIDCVVAGLYTALVVVIHLTVGDISPRYLLLDLALAMFSFCLMFILPFKVKEPKHIEDKKKAQQVIQAFE